MPLVALRDLALSREEWLMERVLAYARERGYTRYTSTLLEAWRLSIAGLTASLCLALARYSAPPEIDPDEDYSGNPMTAFGILEAQRHRDRGITLAMFLGLMKYYRQSYVDLLDEGRFTRKDQDLCRLFVERFFDHVELGFCAEWSRLTEDTALDSLQQANREMTNEKNKYLTIFESLLSPALLLDQTGRLENLNLAAMRLLDRNCTPGGSYYSPKGGDAVMAWLADELTQWQSWPDATFSFSKSLTTDREVRRFDVRFSRMCDISHKFLGTVIAMYDVTELSTAHEVILNSAQTFRALVDAIPESLMLINSDGTVKAVNTTGAARLGQEPKNLVGRVIYDYFPHDVTQVRRARLNQVFTTGDPVHFEDVRCDRWYSNHITPLSKSGGKVTSVAVLGIDVTERRIAEQALAEAHNQFAKQEKMASIGQLAAGMAHEINNPVGFVQSNLSTLAKYFDKLITYLDLERDMVRQYLPDHVTARLDREWRQAKLDFVVTDTRDLIGQSLHGTGRIKKIVQDLMDFSRSHDDESSLLDLNECLENALAIAGNEIGHVAELRREFGEIPPVLGDRFKMAQVFLNLLLNAAQALDRFGVIALRTWEQQGMVWVELSDTGSGIPEELITRVFDPFFTTKEVGKGTGLGLTIAHDIITKHGGEINLKSRVGAGTTVIIRLPAAPPRP